MLKQHLRPSTEASEFIGRRNRVIFSGRVVGKNYFHAFSLGQVAQINVEYIQNLLRLIKDAYPHGIPHLSGSLAANSTSTYSVYTKHFSNLAKNGISETSENCLEKSSSLWRWWSISEESPSPRSASQNRRDHSLCSPIMDTNMQQHRVRR